MAEVIIGGVASGITIGTLASQITSNIIKTKGYWDQIQNAPEEVQDLIVQLEILNEFVADIEDNQRQNPMSSLIWDSNSTTRCLQYCKKAAERLKDLTEIMSVDSKARKKIPRRWASVKVVLKKDKIDRYKGKLETAVTLLSVSQQLYTRISLHNIATSLPPHGFPYHGAGLQNLKALRLTLVRTLLQIQPDILVAKLSRSIVPTPHLCTEGTSDHHLAPQSNLQLTTKPAISIASDREWSSSPIFGHFFYSRECYPITKGKTRDVAGRKIEVEVIVAEYRSPSWLTNKIWHIQAVNAARGWEFSPRAYNVVHLGSLVFAYASSNNVRGLQELFGERKASPFDCNVDGMTPLMYAALNSSFEACDLLIEEGADPNNLLGHGLGSCTALQIAINIPIKISEALPRLLLNETEFTPSLSSYRGSAKGFVLWQEVLDPGYYQRPLEERFEIARVLGRYNEPKVFKTALDRDSVIRPWTEGNCETLNVIARSIGRIWVDYTGGNSMSDHETYHAVLEGWLSMLRDVIALNYCIHQISSHRTPLNDLVLESLFGLESNQDRQLPELLNIWLQGLQDCGVDLEEYGRKETELYEQGLVCWGFSPSPPEIWGITSLTYGSSPSDWSIKLELLDDSDTGTPKDMPGGWVENNESDDGESDDDESDGDESGGEVNEVEVVEMYGP